MGSSDMQSQRERLEGKLCQKDGKVEEKDAHVWAVEKRVITVLL